jgi:drug/metabolite transporter (DMT)-like permease
VTCLGWWWSASGGGRLSAADRALRHASSAHTIVFLGLLPLSTAVFGVLRGGERPRPAFWLFSLLGSACVVGYAVRNGIEASLQADLLMLAAIVVCGLGYAEGGRLARHLGGWQVISWALLLALPVMLPLTVLMRPASFTAVGASAWWALGYVAVFSMLIGFLFWYRGWRRAASPPSASCSCCNRSSAWRWPRCC